MWEILLNEVKHADKTVVIALFIGIWAISWTRPNKWFRLGEWAKHIKINHMKFPYCDYMEARAVKENQRIMKEKGIWEKLAPNYDRQVAVYENTYKLSVEKVIHILKIVFYILLL